MSICFTTLRILTGLGLLVYLGLSGIINWSAIAALAHFWRVSVSALCLLLTIVVLSSYRVCLLIRARGLHLSLLSSVRLTLIGIYFNLFLPGSTGGDIVRVYYAVKGNHGKRTEIATIFFLDRLVGIFALIVLPLLITPLFPQLLQSVKVLNVLLWLSATGSLAILSALAICFSVRATEGSILLRIFHRAPLGEYAKRIYETVSEYRHNTATLACVFAISIAAHSLLVLSILLLVSVTSPQGATGAMALLIPFGLLANSLPVTPGGLGVGEIAFGKLFALAGLTGGAEALLGSRVLVALIGFAGLAVYLRGRQEFLSSATHRQSISCDASESRYSFSPSSPHAPSKAAADSHTTP